MAEEIFRGFVHYSEAWYGKSKPNPGDKVDEVTFGFYYLDGSTTGEMSMVWENLSGPNPTPYLKAWEATPYLKAWEDSWDKLFWMQDVVAMLRRYDSSLHRHDGDIALIMSPSQFCQELLALSFKDRTQRSEPDELAPFRCHYCGHKLTKRGS